MLEIILSLTILLMVEKIPVHPLANKKGGINVDKWDLLKEKQYKQLQEIFKDIDLSDSERKYLEWLWKWDFETREVFLSIFLKLKNGKK